MEEEVASSQLVVVGASAGGIEALQALVAALPRDFPAPLLIAQHLDPHRLSHLGEILQRRSVLPVQTILDHEALQPGRIYVIPADHHVAIADGHLSLRNNMGELRPKPSINLLFTSAAETYGEGLIAVILTGTGSDGAMGALEVKKAGGTVVIQNPATATYPSMPQSLAPTSVDFIANIEDMGQLLYDLLTGASSLIQGSETQVLRTFLSQVLDKSGLDFSAYKPATILRRLKRRMVATNSNSLDEYLRYLDQHPEEYQRLISSFLIKVTEFYRDRELFDALRRDILPRVIEDARHHSKELRIWSAGCATGEEAYSIAMLVAEGLGDELEQFTVRIFATDLDAQAIAYARRGIYPAASLNAAPPELVERYFTREDGEVEVDKRIRSLVVFGQHDLGQRAPFPHIDLVLCRNVLIYFGADLQRRVLQLFAYSLRIGGVLVLGKAETTSPLTEYFAPINALLRIYRRQGDRFLLPAGRVVTPMPLPGSTPTLITGKPGASLHQSRQAEPTGVHTRTSTQRLTDTVFDLPVGIAIVDRRYDVQTINASALRLLHIHRSAVGMDLLHLAESVPQKPLRSVIDAAFRNVEQSEMEVTIEVEGDPSEPHVINVHAYPQGRTDQAAVESVVLVITDITSEYQARADAEAAAASAETAKTDAQATTAEQPSANEIARTQHVEVERLREHVQRLMGSNRELREANAELTHANLDLRQSNEEFLVEAEELQAASEEVETLNEELQASNEELETLNEELQATVEELNTSNDDLEARSAELQRLAAHLEAQRRDTETERSRLEAILVNMGDAVLVVDKTGAIVRTNDAYARMFGERTVLAPENEQGEALPASATPQQRTVRGESFSMEFTLPDANGERHWFEANGQPLKVNGADDGGVIVIRDITDRSLRRLQSEFLAQAAHELRTPLTSAQAALQMLSRRAARSSQQSIERNIGIALAQVRRLTALVNDLVDVARLQNGKLTLQMATVDLASVTRKAVDGLQVRMKQRIELEVEDEPLMVQGDALRLEQVIDNLLINAEKYAPESQVITVTVRRHAGLAELSVSDTGPGMDEAQAGRLFNRFYQVDRLNDTTRSGLGLGLFISREIVLGHGGDITVSTAPGVGSTFTISLPLHSADGEGSAPPFPTPDAK